MKNAIFIVFCLTALFACQSTPSTIGNENQCEDALLSIENQLHLNKSIQSSKSIAGTTVALTVTGITAVTETVLYVGGGLVGGVLICSPLIAIEVSADSDGRASAECVFRVGGVLSGEIIKESKYALTTQVWQGTSGWRVEFYDSLSRGIRKNCECYLTLGEMDHLMSSQKQLLELKNQKSIWKYLSPMEKNRVNDLANRTNQMIKTKKI